MINLRNINKVELGKILMPTKLYKLEYRQECEKLYQKLYFKNPPYEFYTYFFLASIILSIIGFFLAYPTIYIVFNNYIESGIIWKFVVMFCSWFVFNFGIYIVISMSYFMYHDSKFKGAQDEIEEDLPEFIDNMVSNLKGGISLEKAFLKSVRPEQKALLREVTLLNEKIMMGLDVTAALSDFRKRFTSPVLSRTFFLIEEGIKGGGNLASPLERISTNLKRIYALEEEIKANSSGFTIIIRFITILIAPLLFALAITLLVFIGNLFGLIAESGAQVFSVQEIPQEFSDYLRIFSYSMVVLITFFSSLITSQLNNEKTYQALKYLPIYIFLSIMLYWWFADMLLGFFGNIMG